MTEHGHDQKEPWVAVFRGKEETVFEKPGLREQSTDERGRGDLEEDKRSEAGLQVWPLQKDEDTELFRNLTPAENTTCLRFSTWLLINFLPN